MNYIEIYTDFLASHGIMSRPLNVVCDSSNGTTGDILEKLLPKLNSLKFKIINEKPDPEFPAHGPNPLIANALDELSSLVVSENADFGAAFDGDGDRIFFVDNKGEIVSSYVVATLLFRQNKPPYVCDEIIYQTLKYSNIFSEKEILPSRIGQVFIKENIKKAGASVSAEFSGHFNYKDFFNCDSGLFTLVKMASFLSQQKSSLSDLKRNLPAHEIANEDMRAVNKSWDEIKKIIESRFAGNNTRFEYREGISMISSDGWANVRLSNTEPLLRIYAGSDTREKISKLISDIKRELS